MKIKLTTATAGGLALALAAAVPSAAAGHHPTPTVSYTVDTAADTVDAMPGDGSCADRDGHCSLRAAVMEANAAADAVKVTLADGTYALTTSGASDGDAATGDLDVTGHLVIDGSGAVIDLGGLGDRGFDVAADASLKVGHVTVRDGAPPATESGGAFRSEGHLTLRGVIAFNNVVTGDGASGGAVANLGGDLVVERSSLVNNRAERAGGAIEADEGTTVVTGSRLSRNVTGDGPGNGGGLHLTGAGDVTVEGSLVTDNVAAAEGGGLWNSSTGTMTVMRSRILDNAANGSEADSGGGGLYNDGGTLVVTNAGVRGNTADQGSGSGGGILNNGGTLDIDAANIQANSAARAGGGIETVGGRVDLDHVQLKANTAGPNPGNGGGLHITGEGDVDVDHSLVIANTAAAEGGGLWNSSTGTMTVRHTRVLDNVANGEDADTGGGGLYNDGGDLVVMGSVVRGNQATQGSGSGGGILNVGGDLLVTESTIAANTSARAGGGIETAEGYVELRDVALRGNVTGSAPGNGGALHISGAGVVDIDDSDIRNNRAANEGGGLWNSPSGQMTVTDTPIVSNAVGVPGNGPNVFQQGPIDGGSFTVDGETVPAGPNSLAFPA